MQIQDKKLVFTRNNFSIPYTGRLKKVVNNYHYSPSGHRIHFAHPDGRPFAIKFDKGQLLQDLWKDCERLGVELRLETLAYGGSDTGDFVKLELKSKGRTSEIQAKKLVIAEGANAKLTGVFGLNNDRGLFGTPFVLIYTIENTCGFEPGSWNQYYGSAYHPYGEIIVAPSLEDDNTIELTIAGNKQLLPETFYDGITQNSPLKENFANSRIIDKQGCSLRSYAPLKKPYLSNVITIGDSAAHVEVIVQGAIMCGYHAARAINDELQGKNGFEEYTAWWNDAFDFNRGDFKDFISMYGSLTMMPKYTDDELDYLFSLLEGRVLNGDFSQFETPKKLWRSLLEYKEKLRVKDPFYTKK